MEFALLSIGLIYRCSKLGQHGYHTMIGDHRQVFFILCYVRNCSANTGQHLKFKVELKQEFITFPALRYSSLAWNITINKSLITPSAPGKRKAKSRDGGHLSKLNGRRATIHTHIHHATTNGVYLRVRL